MSPSVLWHVSSLKFIPDYVNLFSAISSCVGPLSLCWYITGVGDIAKKLYNNIYTF